MGLTLGRSPLFIILCILAASVGKKTDECSRLKYVVSECDEREEYQWLVALPRGREECKGKVIPEPNSVPCNFVCSRGKSFDRDTLKCEDCPKGSYSLGGGYLYTFDEAKQQKLPPEFTVKAGSTIDGVTSCTKKNVWQVKGNVLRGEIPHYCEAELLLKFKLKRAGSITIQYNLPTSYVFLKIKPQCDTTSEIDDGDNDDDDSEKGKLVATTVLRPTGHGTWRDKKISLPEKGEYTISMYTFGLSVFHFPFSIRSIAIEGTAYVQDCTPCPPGTFASEPGSSKCTPCARNKFASKEGSKRCDDCDVDQQYSNEGSSVCKQRPICKIDDYQKVFTECDNMNMTKIKYEPIQPKICVGGETPSSEEPMLCGSCNPGMYKKNDRCEFCPMKTYSNGTLRECLSCSSTLSLQPGLYYKNWQTLPPFVSRTYASLDETDLDSYLNNQSWVPSLTYISSQALPRILTMLTLTVEKGFLETPLAVSNKEYGTLVFNFSVNCESSCAFILTYADIDDDDNWEIIQKWSFDKSIGHKNVTEYTYSIPYYGPIAFTWLFTTNNDDETNNEVRIYEIRVTNTVVGGSDRCVSCLTTNNQETACQSCTPGYILSNNTCIRCPTSTIASRVRPKDPVATKCVPCPNNTVSDDGVSCYVLCQQKFGGEIEYDLRTVPTLEFHGSKLFTEKGRGYYHVFNASICGSNSSVVCAKNQTSSESKRSTNSASIKSGLCRIGVIPDKATNDTSVAYIDDFGEQLLNVSLWTDSKLFPPLRSDYNLSDITLVYRTNLSAAQSPCSERITYLSLRCDHSFDDTSSPSSENKNKLQTPADCSTGTCDGCLFRFLLRTSHVCPSCTDNSTGYRTFVGPCKLGRQEIRKVPHTYCSHILKEKVESNRCSILSIELQIVLGLFLILATILIAIVVMCWRKNRTLEYRYMQLVQNANPDDDIPVDNVCAQISDEEDSGEEIQFKSQSRAKKLLNVVRKAIRRNPTNAQQQMFSNDSFLLTNTETNEA